MRFIKYVIKKLFINRITARIFLVPAMNMAAFFYRLADTFAMVLNGGGHPKHAIIGYGKWFSDQVGKSWVVVDIGSGDGMVSAAVSEKANFVYGIELSEKNIKKAEGRNKRENVVYINEDAVEYEYKFDKPVDCIILSNILEHLEHRVVFLKDLIKKINWSSGSGTFLLRVPAIDRDWMVLYKKSKGLEYRNDPGHFIEYTVDTLNIELEEAGLSVISVKRCFGEIYVKAVIG
jgi:methyltransferase family protein